MFTLIGVFIGYMWCKSQMTLQGNRLRYGITEQNLSLQSILWEEYPTYRKLTFTINGEISFCTKSNEEITLNYLENPDALQETHRKHNVFFDGNKLLHYDDATYHLNDGKVKVNIPKRYNSNPIMDAIQNSYYLTFNEKETGYIAGCISVLDMAYVAWTEDEIRNCDVNLEAYLSAFRLSDTYDAVKPLRQKAPKDGVELDKKDDGILSYTIENNTGNSWHYENRLPSIELWYKGVWIELNSPFDYNLTSKTIEAMETQHFETQKEIIDQYPTLFSGIYRLVVYGERGEFIVSDVFRVE